MQKEFTTTPKAIDLGLPSGTLWADRNLGAATVMDCGGYYMWGSTEPCKYHPCGWNLTPFNGGFCRCNVDMLETFRSEAFHDGILSDQYDAAHAQLGGKWYMPTKEQLKELIDNTTSEWVTDYQGSGVSGRTFTSKSDSSKSTFIPASGYRYGSSVLDVGHYAFLWSSTLGSGSSNCAFSLDFDSDGCDIENDRRYRGFCVRPVC